MKTQSLDLAHMLPKLFIGWIGIILCVCCWHVSQAQITSLYTSIESAMPTGNLGKIYNPAVGYSVKICLGYHEWDNDGETESNLEVGYVAFHPKADTLYYDLDGGSIGKAAYDPLQILQIRYRCDMIIPLGSSPVSLHPGFSLLGAYHMTSLYYEGNGQETDGGEFTFGVGVGAGFGVGFKATNWLRLIPYYRITTTLRSTNVEPAFAPSIMFYYYQSAGLSLNFMFY